MLKSDVIAWAMMLTSGVCAGIGNMLVKRSRLIVEGSALAAWPVSPWLMAAVVFYLLNVHLLSKSMDSLPLSVAAPIVSGTNFVVVVLGAVWMFGEGLSLVQYLGLGSIVLGIYLVGQAS